MGLKTPTGNWTRSTPRRGPNFQHKTIVFQPWGKLSMKKTSLRPNTVRRAIPQARERMMHDMLAAIGTNPVYSHGSRERAGYFERQWTKNAKAWLDVNQKRYVPS